MIQLFFIANCMRNYFQTSLSEAFDYFFFITSWACGKSQEEQNCISQHSLGTGLPPAWEDRAQWAQCSPAKLHLQQVLLPLPPIRKRWSAFEEGKALMHRRTFLTGNFLETIQHICCQSWHWQPTDMGFNLFFRIVLIEQLL